MRTELVTTLKRKATEIIAGFESDQDPVLITQPVVLGDLIDSVSGVDLSRVQVSEGMNGHLFWMMQELYNDVTRQTGNETGCLVIDLARKLPKNTYLFYDWFHYTNAGAAEVAKIVYSDLQPYLEKKFPGHVKKELIAL